MKKLILALFLLISTTSFSQIYLGNDYRSMPYEQFSFADPCIIQVLSNDSFMVTTRSITGNCLKTIEEIIRDDDGQMNRTMDGIYVSFNMNMSLITIYIPLKNMMVRIQAKSYLRYSYALPEKVLYILTEIRRHDYSTQLASN